MYVCRLRTVRAIDRPTSVTPATGSNLAKHQQNSPQKRAPEDLNNLTLDRIVAPPIIPSLHCFNAHQFFYKANGKLKQIQKIEQQISGPHKGALRPGAIEKWTVEQWTILRLRSTSLLSIPLHSSIALMLQIFVMQKFIDQWTALSPLSTAPLLHCSNAHQIFVGQKFGGGGGNRTPVRKPLSQSYPVIRSDKAYTASVFLDGLVSLSAKDCYLMLAQNRNVFAPRGGWVRSRSRCQQSLDGWCWEILCQFHTRELVGLAAHLNPLRTKLIKCHFQLGSGPLWAWVCSASDRQDAINELFKCVLRVF